MSGGMGRVGWFVAFLLAVNVVVGAAQDEPAPERVRLSSGEVLSVEVVSEDEASVVFLHPVLGEVTIPAGDITLLDRAEATADAAMADVDAEAAEAGDEAAATAEEEVAPLVDAPPKEWFWSFVFAAGGSSGNTQNANLSASLTGKRETEKDRTLVDAAYFFGSADGDRNESRFTTGVLQDWFIQDSKWFWFGDLRFDQDAFQTWEYRLAGHVGPGYKFFEEEDFTLNGRLGAGARREWKSPNDEVKAELLVGVNGTWQITEKQSLIFDATYFPDLTDIGEFRTLSSASWSWLMDEEASMSLTAGVFHEYQSSVAEDRERNDFRFRVGLQFDF